MTEAINSDLEEGNGGYPNGRAVHPTTALAEAPLTKKRDSTGTAGTIPSGDTVTSVTGRGNGTVASGAAASVTSSVRLMQQQELVRQRKRFLCTACIVVVVWCIIAALVGGIVGSVIGK